MFKQCSHYFNNGTIYRYFQPQEYRYHKIRCLRIIVKILTRALDMTRMVHGLAKFLTKVYNLDGFAFWPSQKYLPPKL